MSRKESNNTGNGLLIGLLTLGLILVISFTITKPVETAHGTAMEDQCVKNYDKSMDPNNYPSTPYEDCNTIILKAFQGDEASIKKLKKIGIDVKPDVRPDVKSTKASIYTVKKLELQCIHSGSLSIDECKKLVSKALSGNKASIKSLKGLGINISSDDISSITQDRKSTRLNSSHVALSRMPSSA